MGPKELEKAARRPAIFVVDYQINCDPLNMSNLTLHSQPVRWQFNYSLKKSLTQSPLAKQHDTYEAQPKLRYYQNVNYSSIMHNCLLSCISNLLQLALQLQSISEWHQEQDTKEPKIQRKKVPT